MRRPPTRSSPLADLLGAALPLSARDLGIALGNRIAKLPNRINEYGYDAYGLSPEFLRRGLLPGALLYRFYFRTEVRDIERVPPGRCLLVANHSGQLPFDAMLLAVALLLDAEPPRIARGMGEYWIPRLPFFGTAAARGGALVGTPENCRHMLENDECVMVFPEGVRGMNKAFRERYRLQRFGQGFARVALETGTPVVPVGIVGCEEQQPGLANLPRLARLLGMPAFPLTPTFPWLGPLGLLPLPVKVHILFGEPIELEGDSDDEDAVIEVQVARVRGAIEALLAKGLRARRGIFG
jgi:1-acyl-sn-glycerol-3-phosphate acyltransferase